VRAPVDVVMTTTLQRESLDERLPFAKMIWFCEVAPVVHPRQTNAITSLQKQEILPHVGCHASSTVCVCLDLKSFGVCHCSPRLHFLLVNLHNDVVGVIIVRTHVLM